MYYLLGSENFLNCSYINLNYDILLDNALLDLYDNQNIDLNYHIEFANYEFNKLKLIKNQKRFNSWSKPRESQSIDLIKLHGSLNWLLCPLCNRIELTPKSKGATQCVTNSYKCEWDDSEQNILIVPPTFEILLQNPNIQKLWSVAESLIRQSDIVYFIGYGLNEYDIFIRKMLKKFILQGNEKKIYLICRSPRSEEQQSNENNTTRRYKSFFSKNVIDTELSFESFIERVVFLDQCDRNLLENRINDFEGLVFNSIDTTIPKNAYIKSLKWILDNRTDKKILTELIKQNKEIKLGKLKTQLKLDINDIKTSIRRLLNFNLITKVEKREKTSRFDLDAYYKINTKWNDDLRKSSILNK